MTRRPIESIIVVGGGMLAVSAALAFARNLPGVTVRLLETPADPASLADHVPATTPLVHRFHAAIGVDELDLVRSGVALHRLGTRFDNWSASAGPWFHGFERRGYPADGVPFHQVWLREQHAAFDAWSVAAALARGGRFVHPSEDLSSPLSAFLYGLNLDPDRYRAFLLGMGKGMARIGGEIAAVERAGDGRVAGIKLHSGEVLSADLYVDCSGLLADAVDSAWQEWSDWLPCNRFAFTDGPVSEAVPFDHVVADDKGWTWSIPLPGRCVEVRARRADDEPARGRRTSAWVGNVLAIGDAAMRIDPLHGAALHLAHSAVLRALQHIPGADMHALEIAEYNRLTALEADRARDFLALHYLRPGSDGPIWRDAPAPALPAGLARTLEQFERRGRLPLFEEECFDPDSWLAVLIGLGLRPQAVDPVALGIDGNRARAGMDALADRIAATPSRFPPYAQLLAQLAPISRRAD